LANGRIAIEVFELNAQTIVVVQAVSEGEPGQAAWLNSAAQIKQLGLKHARNPGLKIRMMAFTDGSQPEESVRKDIDEIVKRWKMPIIFEPNGFGAAALKLAVSILVTITKAPAKVFGPNDRQAIYEYMELSRGEQLELDARILAFEKRNPGFKALGKFAQNLPSIYKMASNS
jgi:hypothetical protein